MKRNKGLHVLRRFKEFVVGIICIVLVSYVLIALAMVLESLYFIYAILLSYLVLHKDKKK